MALNLTGCQEKPNGSIMVVSLWALTGQVLLRPYRLTVKKIENNRDLVNGKQKCVQQGQTGVSRFQGRFTKCLSSH